MPAEITHREQITRLRQLLVRLAGEPIPYFDEFAALFRRRSLGKGEFFVCAGDTTDSVAFVSSGVARMFADQHPRYRSELPAASPPWRELLAKCCSC